MYLQEKPHIGILLQHYRFFITQPIMLHFKSIKPDAAIEMFDDLEKNLIYYVNTANPKYNLKIIKSTLKTNCNTIAFTNVDRLKMIKILHKRIKKAA